ncbi:ATP-binding protein [Haloechinothrix salitolerans]|uniref:ATP-binding protein n=1 Tax=Haloechinothrix salitolerans TaxID=926830 RepID=A0ABW2CA82_9PSEU
MVEDEEDNVAGTDTTRGIRLVELRLGGLAARSRSYRVDFRMPDRGPWRPLSVIAGPSQTGKTSVIDFIRYCMGGSEHPQHPEVLASVRAALLEAVLSGESATIERAATGPASKFASLWEAALDELQGATELRLPVEPTSEPSGLSQRLLAACGLDNIELPEAPTQTESSTQMLSIRDLFRVMWLPNERLDNKNLVFEHSSFMVGQKLRQTIDVMFDVHDADGSDIAARLKRASDAAREAARTAKALRAVVEAEHALGPLVLETDRDRARSEAVALRDELARLDADRASRDVGVGGLRQALVAAQEEARAAAVRVRNRESLVERLAALRGQYADDKKKLTFLKEAERLFDPLHVTVCPACLSTLDTSPAVLNGECTLCGHRLLEESGVAVTGLLADPDGSASSKDPRKDKGSNSAAGTGILEAELRATARRLDELNDYWVRLDDDLGVLRAAQAEANLAVENTAAALNRVVTVPAPYLAARDEIARRRADARLREQQAEAGLRLWDRVREAEEVAERLAGQAARLRAERREAATRPDRAAVVRLLSDRFGDVLSDIGYPKLSAPSLNERLVPSVRGLTYTAASSGGLVLISLAWYLALWEIAHEQGARAPGLLMIDSPQKNLGHAAQADDPDFADVRLVENFYRHAKNWLAGPGQGAQLVVVDNSPPDSVAADVVVRYTRDPATPPYGLIEDAID